MKTYSSDLLLAAAYFSLSTLITWWFVVVSPVYISDKQMLLSTFIAGSKWGLQILAALILLKGQRWVFIKNIGFVCFVGSCILLPFVVGSLRPGLNLSEYFVGSLVASVATMIVLYFRAARKSAVSLSWWYFWLLCLVIAVTLQLTVVFHVIGV